MAVACALAFAGRARADDNRVTPPAVDFGRSFGEFSVAGNLGAGEGLDDDRYTEGGLAAYLQLAPDLRLGLEARLRLDLDGDDSDDAAEGASDWELVAGPLVVVTAGRWLVTAGLGLSAFELRQGDAADLGALFHLGIGTIF
jgi:hypothetical protein